MAPFVVRIATAIVGLTGAVAAAQAPRSAVDDVPLADYLGLLAQIAPAAREGAGTYLLAYQRRCGRSLSTLELRRAISDGEGDSVLMAMIRASELRDAASLERLGQHIDCRGGSTR